MQKLPENCAPMLNITVNDYESGVFEVGQTIVPIPRGSNLPVDWENVILLYKGDQSRGAALFGIGMINKIVADGGQSVLVYRTGDTPVYFDVSAEE